MMGYIEIGSALTIQDLIDRVADWEERTGKKVVITGVELRHNKARFNIEDEEPTQNILGFPVVVDKDFKEVESPIVLGDFKEAYSLFCFCGGSKYIRPCSDGKCYCTSCDKVVQGLTVETEEVK